MDGLLVTGIAISLALASGLAVFFLVARVNRQVRASRQRDGVVVADLVNKAIREGEPLRLHWTEAELDAYGRVRPSAHDDLPTAVFPIAKDPNNRFRYKQP